VRAYCLAGIGAGYADKGPACAASNDLPTSSPGATLNIAHDGLAHVVTLYGKIYAQDFRTLPGGAYTAAIIVTVEY
jgi:spore coat protein U-like protein